MIWVMMGGETFKIPSGSFGDHGASLGDDGGMIGGCDDTVVLHRAIYPHLRKGLCGSRPGPRWRGVDWGGSGEGFYGFT